MPQSEKILKNDKQLAIFKDLLQTINKLAKHNYLCTPENATLFHENANAFSKAYSDSKILLHQGSDLTTRKIQETLPRLLDEILDVSALLNTVKIREEVKNLFKDDDSYKKHIEFTENYRARLMEEEYKLSGRLLSIQQKAQQLVSTIENTIKQTPEIYGNNVRCMVDGGIIKKIIFKVDRPDFTAANTRFFKRGKKQDIRHLKSNEMMKLEIKKMFEGQPFNLVAEHLEQGFGKKIENVAMLQDAIMKLWHNKFNEPSNLRVGDSKSNQALGRLIPRLKKKIDEGKENFKPFELEMREFGYNIKADPKDDEIPSTIKIEDWQMLLDYYLNAHYDFTFQKENMAKELDEAEHEFNFTCRR